MRRRSFLKAVASAVPALSLHDLVAQAPVTEPATAPHVVGYGEDRYGDPHSLGFGSMAFKVTTAETGGGLFVIEHTHLGPGGPPLHLHPNQEEWFYVMEGEVAFLVGEQRLRLRAGESILAPRRVPHIFICPAVEPPADRLLPRGENGTVLPRCLELTGSLPEPGISWTDTIWSGLGLLRSGNPRLDDLLRIARLAQVYSSQQ